MAQIQTQSPLTDDEVTVLMIANERSWLAPIGRWEKPIHSLASRGLMVMHDAVNYGITAAGTQALAGHEAESDRAFAGVLEKAQGARQAQAAISDFAEQAAHHLANAGKASAAVTADTPDVAVRKWSEVILKRALELL